ncbi:MAG: Ppx/GppA phosphatase family protein [Chloroflexota bacterium]
MIFAAIDVGSNTIHLLVAECNGRTLASLVDQSARLRLGADVARGRAITPSKMALAATTVSDYVITAQQHRAQTILLMGTQAVRAATNGPDLVRTIERATGLPLKVLSPKAEARLGCLGTQLDAPDAEPHLILDIGGGSTQLSLAEGSDQLRFLGSLPVGSVSLATRFLLHDPPTKHARSQLEPAVRDAVAAISLADPPASSGQATAGAKQTGERSVGTAIEAPVSPRSPGHGNAGEQPGEECGGTASTPGHSYADEPAGQPSGGVAADSPSAPGYGIIIGGVGRRLRKAGRLSSGEPLVRLWVERLVDAVMSVSAETLEVLGAARKEDVDMIRSGAVILREVMHAYGLQYCLVSNNGIREGAVLALARGEEVDDGC